MYITSQKTKSERKGVFRSNITTMTTFPLESFSENLKPEFPLYHITNDGRLFSKRSRNGIGESKFWHEHVGALDKLGYKRFLIRNSSGERKTVLAHRLVAGVYIGDIPSGMMVCHNDGNPRNNNLLNLRIDTELSNQTDRIKHGTRTQGEEVNTNVLSEEQVFKAYEMAAEGMFNTQIAFQFGVNPTAIDAIFRRRNWKFLQIPQELVDAADKNRKRRQKSTIKREDILTIFQKKKNGMPPSQIAEIYNANPATIYAILNRINWRHVDIPRELLP